MTPEERFDRIERQQETNTNAIRDLIQVSRAAVDNVIRLENVLEDKITRMIDSQEKGFAELHEMNKHTDEKLNALIGTIDRMIRSNRPPEDREQP